MTRGEGFAFLWGFASTLLWAIPLGAWYGRRQGLNAASAAVNLVIAAAQASTGKLPDALVSRERGQS